MQCFRSFHTAERALEGIEALHMIRRSSSPACSVWLHNGIHYKTSSRLKVFLATSMKQARVSSSIPGAPRLSRRESAPLQRNLSIRCA